MGDRERDLQNTSIIGMAATIVLVVFFINRVVGGMFGQGWGDVASVAAVLAFFAFAVLRKARKQKA